MKKIFLIFLIVLLFAGVWSSFAEDGQAVILEVQGTVETKAEGSPDWKAAAPGDLITNRTVVSTGFKSTAVISLGSSTLNILPLTRLTVEEIIRRDTTEDIRLGLQTGRIRADVRPPAGSRTSFTVRAPAATASVRGTSFEFDGKHLWVDEGTVLLAGANGQRGYVGGGQRSYVDANNQNRVVPPFEVETALLTPQLPELDRTGGGFTEEPFITAAAPPSPPPVPPAPEGTDISVGFDWP